MQEELLRAGVDVREEGGMWGRRELYEGELGFKETEGLKICSGGWVYQKYLLGSSDSVVGPCRIDDIEVPV